MHPTMDAQSSEPGAVDQTGDLLDRARAGDESALDQLFERHLPELRLWAHGRLPRWACDIADTTDLIQETILEVMTRPLGPQADWLQNRERLAALYRRVGRNSDAQAIEAELLTLLAVADADHPIRRRLEARARPGAGPP